MPELGPSRALIGKALQLSDGRQVRLDRLVNDNLRPGWEAQVYQAVDLQAPEEKFAVKCYGSAEIRGEVYDRACSNARRAYRVGSLLDHPGIAATIDLVAERFLVSEWVAGPRLSRIMRGGKYRPQAAAAWVIALGEALAALTDGLASIKSGFGHGDVQPTNAIFQPGAPGTGLKLIDLDYVGRPIKRPGPVTETTLAWTGQVGREVLKPPEYALGSEPFLDTCSDCFSFGLVVFWLLRRTPAFKYPDEYRQKILILAGGGSPAGAMAYPSGIWEIRREPLGRVLMDMTAFDRRTRIGSVGEAVELLRPAVRAGR